MATVPTVHHIMDTDMVGGIMAMGISTDVNEAEMVAGPEEPLGIRSSVISVRIILLSISRGLMTCLDERKNNNQKL